MKIKITTLSDNKLIGKFKGIYLDDTPILANSSKGHGGCDTLTLHKNNELYLDFEASPTPPILVGFIYKLEGVPRIALQNVKNGIVLNVTKAKFISSK